MKYVLALVASARIRRAGRRATCARRQKGPNGGPMEDVAGVHAELVTAGNTITINVFDEGNKPLATKGFSGSALVVRGSERETVTLAPSGESALKGEAKKPAAGAAITVTLKTAAGKSGQARFKP